MTRKCAADICCALPRRSYEDSKGGWSNPSAFSIQGHQGNAVLLKIQMPVRLFYLNGVFCTKNHFRPITAKCPAPTPNKAKNAGFSAILQDFWWFQGLKPPTHWPLLELA
ncbi:MAG: hypothetical protein JF609_09560 [Verrucomicrobia bacterium]|nr:hypothetical protein [Verrucomicrobiota bacterium]